MKNKTKLNDIENLLQNALDLILSKGCHKYEIINILGEVLTKLEELKDNESNYDIIDY